MSSLLTRRIITSSLYYHCLLSFTFSSQISCYFDVFLLYGTEDLLKKDSFFLLIYNTMGFMEMDYTDCKLS